MVQEQRDDISDIQKCKQTYIVFLAVGFNRMARDIKIYWGFVMFPT